MKPKFAIRAAGAVLVPLMMLGTSAALADPDHEDLPNFGQVGDVTHIDQVIEVDMGEMYFDPDGYTFERGETVKFVLVNNGRAVHEFSIGTDETQNAHEQEMKAMLRSGMMTTRVLRHDRMLEAGMMHVDANARLLEPDETSELVWTFSGEQDELIIACNIPGHRAAGMKAVVTIGEEHSG
jgi:uncharacterized cupredoxin-like copper-binding protein